MLQRQKSACPKQRNLPVFLFAGDQTVGALLRQLGKIAPPVGFSHKRFGNSRVRRRIGAGAEQIIIFMAVEPMIIFEKTQRHLPGRTAVSVKSLAVTEYELFFSVPLLQILVIRAADYDKIRFIDNFLTAPFGFRRLIRRQNILRFV